MRSGKAEEEVCRSYSTLGNVSKEPSTIAVEYEIKTFEYNIFSKEFIPNQSSPIDAKIYEDKSKQNNRE